MSAVSFHEVRLEIVRPGKPHNQLLSPLTPYMALCGEGSPVTFHVGIEHHQLMTRLERLRYVTPGAGGMVAVPDRMREAELAQLGEDIARILVDNPTLSTALARAQGTRQNDRSESAGNIVHLRLVLSGSELSLIPFELAIAPQGYPGEGVEFCLQSSLPVVLTREVHRDRPRAACWGQQGLPKILFVWAEPAGLKVPAKEHVDKLRAAIEPWTRRVAPNATGDGGKAGETTPAPEEVRLAFVKERLRLLPNASVEQIYRMCAEERFTHIHILAHGDTYNEGGVDRFGVALCRDGDPQRKEVISGKRLAKALLAEDEKGAGRTSPVVVTMATCDAGNQSQVLVPGGSIAHELHGEGIPWVFASQFPLTKSGSVRMVEIIYKRLLRGDDPRQMSFELRRELYRSGGSDHDWASMVTYSSVPANFEEEVADYAWAQTKAAIEVSLKYADQLTLGEGKAVDLVMAAEARRVIAEVRELLNVSKARMPAADSHHSRWRRAEIIGMQGSTLKRMALLMAKMNDKDVGSIYDEALDSYRRAMEEAVSATDKYYWTATQYLSLCAVRNGPKDGDSFELARRLALRDTETARDKSTRAWAHGTVAELELLGPYHARRKWKGVEEVVVQHCRAVVDLMGPESFHVGSTGRQFRRYLEYWDDPKNPQRREVAAAAVRVLENVVKESATSA